MFGNEWRQRRNSEPGFNEMFAKQCLCGVVRVRRHSLTNESPSGDAFI